MGDWIRLAINQGKKCYAFEIGEADFNVNEQTDIYEAENYILSSQRLNGIRIVKSVFC